MIKALQEEVENPAVAAFIAAADLTLNSNSYVMRFDLGRVPAPSDYAAALTEVVESEPFSDAMYAGDVGFWNNYHTIDLEGGEVHFRRHVGSFLAPDFAIECRALPRYACVDRLVWLLSTKRGSWRHQQMPVRHARRMVARFLAALFGITDAHLVRCAEARKELVALIPADVMLVGVTPSFLNSTAYWDGGFCEPQEGRLGYFAGGRDDTCTVMMRGTTCTIVLTNGHP